MTLPYIPLALWEVPLLLSSYETGHPFYPLHDILRILLFVFSHGVLDMASPWLLGLTSIPFIFLFLAGVLLGEKKLDPAIDSDIRRGETVQQRREVTLLLYLFLPIIGVYLISLGMPIFTERYLIYVAPAFYFILARGLAAVKLRSNAVFALCLALVLILDVKSVWAQSHTKIKSDFRSATQYFALQREPDDLAIFLMPYVRHTFEYYYRGDYHSADSPCTNDGMSESELEALLDKLTKGHRSVWLVASEAESCDKRGLVKAWLDGNGKLVDEKEFAMVRIYRYEWPVSTASQ
jgi:hypothetical protein